MENYYKTSQAVVNENRAMELNNLSKKGRYTNSRFSLFLTLLMLLLFYRCDKVQDDDNIELPEYLAIDEDLGDVFDYTILGLNGYGYFYEFQDEKKVPQRLSIYDGTKGELDLVINFDNDGLPKNILSENVTIVLGKYEGNKFSAVVITKDGESHFFENIETDIDWEEYKNEIISGGILRSSTQTTATRSFLGSIIKPLIKVTNVAVGAVTCLTGHYVSCLTTIVDIGDAVGLWDSPQIYNDISFLGNFKDFANCTNLLGCLPSLLGMAEYEIERRENSKKEDIIKGELMLQNNDIFEIFDDLGIEINKGSNPPLIEGTYLISPYILVSSNFDDSYSPGYHFANKELTFSKQDNSRLTVDCDYIHGFSSGSGLGSFITGDGNMFSVYVPIAGYIDGYQYKTIEVYSGEISQNGIKNFTCALIITMEAPNTIKNGQGRLVYDSDRFSERISSSNKSVKSVLSIRIDSSTAFLPSIHSK